VVVVAPEQSLHVGLAGKNRLHAAEGVGVHHNVRIDEHQHVTGGHLGPAVASVGRAARSILGRKHACAVCGGDVRRTVG